MAKKNHVFPKIEGFDKYIICRGCRKRVKVDNLNQKLCDRCERDRQDHWGDEQK